MAWSQNAAYVRILCARPIARDTCYYVSLPASGAHMAECACVSRGSGHG